MTARREMMIFRSDRRLAVPEKIVTSLGLAPRAGPGLLLLI